MKNFSSRIKKKSKPCTICGEWQGEYLSSKNGIQVVRCRKCNLYYVDTSQLDSHTQALEEIHQSDIDLASEYFSNVYEKKSHAWVKYYKDWVRKIEKWSPGKRLLDIGCGIGYLVRTAYDLGWDAYGLDTSSDSINYGKELLTLHGRLNDKTLGQFRFTERFDAITMFSVIEHVDDPYKLILEVRSALKPNGILVIKTPSQASLVTKLHWGLNRITNSKYDLNLYNQEHIYRFSPKTLRLLLDKAGFEEKYYSPDDRLWITATRYLFNNRQYKHLSYIAMAGVNIVGKLIRMENQFVVIARMNNTE